MNKTKTLTIKDLKQIIEHLPDDMDVYYSCEDDRIGNDCDIVTGYAVISNSGSLGTDKGLDITGLYLIIN